MTNKNNRSVAVSYVDAEIQNCACKTWRRSLSESALRAQILACRNLLLASGSRPDMFFAARAEGGDGIIVDLKFAVAPADKQEAREAALTFFRQPQEAGFVRMQRINSPPTVEGPHDLLALRRI